MNNKCDNKKILPIYTPLKLPGLLAFKRTLLNLFTAMRKRREEKGDPYPSPLSGLNRFENAPLIKTPKEIEDKQHTIQLI